ncbi:hypothetical protein LTR86_010574 [Recurvomyces mirabilis]|nr:hypothetical protein LTR86_010574 [Recurvomyces mirabilis]
MGKPKQFTRPPKKQKGKTEPQAADEFQEAADLEEETGGKWRAGDPAKSGRAFVRALDIYDKGLQRHPKSFDLAYNKARLELEITQRPAIVSHIGQPLVDLLKQTLDSHRYALKLNEQNPDVLFNTSQVLTSLAEQLSDEDDTGSAIELLQEALELLSACLSRQEMLLEQQQIDLEDIEGGGVALDPDEKPASTAGSDQSEQTVTIETPITASDLLDTVVASMSALTTLIALVEHHALDALGDMAQSLTERKAPTYIAEVTESERFKARFAIALARANFVAALASAQFDAFLLEADTYLNRLSDVFSFEGKGTDTTSLSSEASARTELVLSLLQRYEGSPDLPADLCWKQLTLAQQLYTTATKLESTAEVYLSRGDVESLRHRIASTPANKLSAAVQRSAPTLAQNAQTYYAGAVKLASSEDAGVREKALSRLSVATALRGLLYQVDPPSDAPGPPSHNTLGTCVEDGLLDADVANRIASMSFKS